MLVAMIEQNDRAFYCIDAQHDASVKRFARSGWRHGIRLITDLKSLVLQNNSVFLVKTLPSRGPTASPCYRRIEPLATRR